MFNPFPYSGYTIIENLNFINMIASLLLACSIVANAQLRIRWMQFKQIYNAKDTILNTGMWKGLSLEVLIIFIQPYPFLQNVTYKEYDNGAAIEKLNADFDVNDALLSAMILLRSYFISRSLLRTTEFTDPRAQRVW